MTFSAETVFSRPPRVALFVTCLVDLFRPAVGFASVKLLEDAGCEVSVPRSQTCCGQPAYNSGDRASAAGIAQSVIASFEPYDFTVVPSGSCGGMLKHHYPRLMEGDPDWGPRAAALSGKVFELTSFLTDVLKVRRVNAQYFGRVTYHDSCSSLREMKIKDQPRDLLKSVNGLELKEMPDTDVCCGFGGLFSVKYPNISNAMVTQKAVNAAETEADLLLGNDLGCLLNIAGKLNRDGKPIRVRHVAEILGMVTDEPPLCTPRSR